LGWGKPLQKIRKEKENDQRKKANRGRGQNERKATKVNLVPWGQKYSIALREGGTKKQNLKERVGCKITKSPYQHVGIVVREVVNLRRGTSGGASNKGTI